ncbi:MAG: hypothetical protein Q8L48_08935 [Archangium sp.]|nr:hypothetical protein [Archangium sp.]
MLRAFLPVLFFLATACGRGPGTLHGTEESPFDLRQTRLWREQRRLVIDAQDKETTCGQKLKTGTTIQLVFSLPDGGLPHPGRYAISDVRPVRLVTDTSCAVSQSVAAEAGEVEVVEVREAVRSMGPEVDLRVNLTFAGAVVQGSLHATTCAFSAAYCDAN